VSSDCNEATVNFLDDADLQEQVKARCADLGMSRSEFFRKKSRELLGQDGLDSSESMLARADELDADADDLIDEADELETRADLKRSEAERKREDANTLRKEAAEADTYEESIEDLAAWVAADDNRRLFAEHKLVKDAAVEHGVSPAEVLADVQEFSALPDERFAVNAGDSR
jgi:hypothetical protein